MRLFSVLSVAAAVPTADATWSIIATDQNTGEVGVAATTCRVGRDNAPATFKDDYWLEPENPDAGIQGLVAAAQASAASCQSEFQAKYYVENPERKEMTPELAVENYDKQGQPWSYDRNDAVRSCGRLDFQEIDQLAVVDYCDSAVKTGANVDLDRPDGKGTYKGFTFSIQGNQLVKADGMGTPFEDGGAAFITAAKDGFTFKRDKDDDRGCDLAERLMQGLLEGNEIGIDNACDPDDESTNIYYMSVIDKDGVEVLPNGPYFGAFYNNEDAVDQLHTRFQTERAGGEWCTKSKSSKSAYPCPKGKSGKSNASTKSNKGVPKKSKGSKSSLLANVELQFLADDASMSMSMSVPTFENGADIARG